MALSIDQLLPTLVAAPAFVCIDVAATCSNTLDIPKEESEIIEIGSAFNFGDGVIWSKSQIIHPEKHPILTEFCIRLTGVTQAKVDAAPTLKDYLTDPHFKQLISRLPPGSVWCSWGHFDQRLFTTQAKEAGISHPFETLEHINVKALDTYLRKASAGRGLMRAAIDYTKEWKGRHHSSMDDAHNLSRLVREIIRRNIHNDSMILH